MNLNIKLQISVCDESEVVRTNGQMYTTCVSSIPEQNSGQQFVASW